MAHSARDVAAFVPPEEVPAWVHDDQIGIYLIVIPATMVIYDAGKSYHLTNRTLAETHLVCTFDKEVSQSMTRATFNV